MVFGGLNGIETELLAALYAARVGTVTEFFLAVTALGSVTIAAFIILGLWIYGRRRTAILSALGVGLAGGTTKLLKIVIARARPEEAMLITEYGADSYAFPSGHATIAFALATVLAAQTERTAARAYFYGLAVLVAVSRVYLGYHYMTDVVAGAFIGTAGAVLVIHQQERLFSLVQKYVAIT